VGRDAVALAGLGGDGDIPASDGVDSPDNLQDGLGVESVTLIEPDAFALKPIEDRLSVDLVADLEAFGRCQRSAVLLVLVVVQEQLVELDVDVVLAVGAESFDSTVPVALAGGSVEPGDVHL